MHIYIVLVSDSLNSISYEAAFISFASAKAYISNHIQDHQKARRPITSTVVWFDSEHANIIKSGNDVLVAGVSFRISNNNELAFDYYVRYDTLHGTCIEALAECAD